MNAQTRVRDDSLLVAARGVIAKVPYCGLITRAADGSMNARVVQQFQPDSVFTIWIGTNPLSRKVAEVTRNPNATMLCEAANGDYVTLVGHAAVVRDATSRERHWNPAWKTFYKDEWRGSDYVLIRFVPDRLEIVSYEFGISAHDAKWTVPAVKLMKKAK